MCVKAWRTYSVEGNKWYGYWLQREKERQGRAERWGENVFSNVNLQRMSTQQIINTGVNGWEKKIGRSISNPKHPNPDNSLL